MKEEKANTPDVEAILANEELMKKLAAKVLDPSRQKLGSSVVCEGYYRDIAKDDQNKILWEKKLASLSKELEEGLAESAAAEYPLNAEELDQVATEIKTSNAYAEKLSSPDLARAVGKVLADNEMMRRKGGIEVAKLTSCDTSINHTSSCSSTALHTSPCSSTALYYWLTMR